ncbi:MAG TPA: class I lanthipeptide [Frankiaceae bacterium]|nr:class I lanthipeptide [Frankiaceae bacterium]
MRAVRKLTLTKETLTELSTGELEAVAGGDATMLCPTPECVTGWVERMFSQLFYPCLR